MHMYRKFFLFLKSDGQLRVDGSNPGLDVWSTKASIDMGTEWDVRRKALEFRKWPVALYSIWGGRNDARGFAPLPKDHRGHSASISFTSFTHFNHFFSFFFSFFFLFVFLVNYQCLRVGIYIFCCTTSYNATYYLSDRIKIRIK